MSLPLNHGLITGGYYPLLHRQISLLRSEVKFLDNYEKIFKRLQIDRHELLSIFPSIMNVDPLVGTAQLKYIDE
jgi:hypothetical protein